MIDKMMNKRLNMPARLMLAVSLLGLCSSVGAWANEMVMPQPTAKHAWLQQFVGEWESKTEAFMMPGHPPEKSVGTETIKPLGEFWTVTEVKGTMMNAPFVGNFTLGYDTDKQKYVATWVDSMTGKLWEYEGDTDPTGKKLTMEGEGSCPMRPDKTTRFREVLEIKDKNHKIYTSYMLDDNGQWQQTMTSTAVRKE